MITDIHAHLFDPSWYPNAFIEALIKDFVRRQQKVGKPIDLEGIRRQLCRSLTDNTGEKTLGIMDKVGIDKKIILIVDWGIALGEGEKSIWEIHKEILSICRRFNDRLLGFAGVDPRRKDASDIVSWAFDNLGAKGLKLHPTSEWTLTEDRTKEIVNIASVRRLPVMIHLGKTIDILSDKNAKPGPFIELARQFPEIPFIAGHCGFDLWEVFAISDFLPENIFFDISGWQGRIRNEATSIMDDLIKLHQLFPKRVGFGTDSPFFSFNFIQSEKQWVGKIIPPFINKWAIVDTSLSVLFPSFISGKN
jgi:predicted TIM-barrel fold metal-dependent hydrolase